MSSSIPLQTLNSQGIAQGYSQNEAQDDTQIDAHSTEGLSEASSQHEQLSLPNPVQTGSGSANGSVLHSAWSWFSKERTYQVALFSLVVGIVVMIPTFGQYMTGLWSSAKEYHEWCRNEQAENHTLTQSCRAIVNRPLPPPPGLDQIFKGIIWKEVPPAPPTPPPAPGHKREDDDPSSLQLFFRTPMGNGVAFALISFYMLRLSSYNPQYKAAHFHAVYFLFTQIYEGSGVYIQPLFQASLLMDWIHWIHKLPDLNLKKSSIPAFAFMPIFYALGYWDYRTDDESIVVPIILHIISALVAGDTYTNRAVAQYYLFKAVEGLKGPELTRSHYAVMILGHLMLYFTLDKSSVYD